MLIVNEVLTANEISGVKSSDELIKKCKKLLKLKNCLDPKNRLSQEKNRQKVEIYLILVLKKTSQAS